MKKTLFFSFLIAGAMFTGCDSGASGEAEDTEAIADPAVLEEEPVAAEVVLLKGEDSPEYPDAILEQTQPNNGATLQPGPTTFEYNVKNYELTKMTEDAHNKMLANSGKGQHIHLILNNEPYDALYETTHKKELPEGHYVELAFLSRSYHESIKNPDAYVLRQFTVGNAENKNVDLNAPHLFYSRPKGEYVGKDAEKIMLDFYLVNTELSETGNKIRATVNGEEFMITDWKPYYLSGLPEGENTIKLELLDATGNLVQSPFNPVTRTITVKKDAEPAAM